MILLCLGLITTTSALVYFTFLDKNLYQTTETTSSRIRYVLVNEDEGAQFQGKTFQLGADFVTMINQDSENSWETASRTMAQNGIDNDLYDVVIIIPKGFSEDLLSLESIDPSKATLEYIIREGQNAAANHQIQMQANQVLASFNQRVIQMYFSSILGNLTEAQNTVSRIVRNETTHTNTLISQIQTPFSDFPSSFESIYALSNQLKIQNDLFDSQQETFVKAMQELLNSNSTALTTTSESVTNSEELLKQLLEKSNKNFQLSLDQFAAQLENQAQQLEKQWSDDKEHYALYRDLVTKQLEEYYKVSLAENGEDTTNYVSFLSAYKNYREQVLADKKTIEEAIVVVESERAELQETLKQLAEKYYGGLVVDGVAITNPNEITDKEVQRRVISKVLQAENTELKKYTEAIDRYIGSVSLQNIESILSTLESEKLISSDKANQYRAQLTILKAYSSANGFSTEQSFKEPVSPEQTGAIETATTLSVGVQEGEHRIEFLSENDQIEMSVSAESIQEQLQRQLENVGYTATVAIDGNAIVVNFAYDESKAVTITEETASTTATTTESTSSSTTTSSSEADTGGATTPSSSEASTGTSTETSSAEGAGSATTPSSSETSTVPPTTTITKTKTVRIAPDRVSFTVPITYKWKEFGGVAYKEAAITWSEQSHVLSKNTLSIYDGTTDNISSQIDTILDSFVALERASQAISVLYGDPEKLNELEIASELSQGVAIDDLSTRSMLDLYRTIPAEKIPEAFVTNYWLVISDIYTTTVDQLKAVDARLGTDTIKSTDKNGRLVVTTNTDVTTLYGLKNSLALPEQLEVQVEALFNWYQTANEAIQSAWKESKLSPSNSVLSDDNAQPSATDISEFSQQLAAIVTELSTLSTDSKQLSATIVESAAKVEDITPAIEELTTTTNTVQKSAQTILTELNQTISETSDTLVENQDYSENFSNVMANSKIGGTDNPAVFNFLSAPILMEGTQATVAVKSLLPYYMTLVGSLVAAMTGFLLSRIMRDRTAKIEESFVVPNRLWLNVPNVTKVGLLSATVAFAFAALTSAFAQGINDGMWFIYTLFFIFATTNILTLGLRLFKQHTYYIMALVFGIYLILTPVLGVSTKAGSLISIIYRISPLQNIEAGYSSIIAGNSIGMASLIVLLFVGIGGLLLNFLVKNKQGVEEK